MGFPDSGTVIFSTYDNFEGFFIVDGKHLRSTYSDDEEDTSMYINLKSDGTFRKSGGADTWATGYPPRPVDGAMFTMTAGCDTEHFNGKQTRTLTGR